MPGWLQVTLRRQPERPVGTALHFQHLDLLVEGLDRCHQDARGIDEIQRLAIAQPEGVAEILGIGADVGLVAVEPEPFPMCSWAHCSGKESGGVSNA